MYIWTEKAERDYRMRYPHRKNERKAGTVVKWEGRDLTVGSILDGYASRGWVRKADEDKPLVVKVQKNSKKGHYLPQKELKKRWCKLIYYMSQPGKMSIESIAQAMGYKSHHSISDLVESHGVELATRYGKLPYYASLRSPKWQRVMEARQ